MIKLSCFCYVPKYIYMAPLLAKTFVTEPNPHVFT